MNKKRFNDSRLPYVVIEPDEFNPDNEYPIFVITILNGFNSEVILNKLIDTIEKACKLKSY